MICLFIFTPTDAWISSTGMLPTGCAIMHYTLYAQLFLQPQLLLHRERTVSTVKQFLRLQRVLHKEKSLVKWVPWQLRCDSVLLTHSLTPRVLYKAGYCYYCHKFSLNFLRGFHQLPCEKQNFCLYMKHPCWYNIRGFQSHTTHLLRMFIIWQLVSPSRLVIIRPLY